MLKALNLRLSQPFQINLKQLTHLEDVYLDFLSFYTPEPLNNILRRLNMQESTENCIKYDFPDSLKRLKITNRDLVFNMNLKSLTNLTNLNSLMLHSLKKILIDNRNPFGCFKNLKTLKIYNSRLILQKHAYLSQNEIQIGPECLENLMLDFSKCIEHPKNQKIHFDNVPLLKNLVLLDNGQNTGLTPLFFDEEKKQSING